MSSRDEEIQAMVDAQIFNEIEFAAAQEERESAKEQQSVSERLEPPLRNPLNTEVDALTESASPSSHERIRLFAPVRNVPPELYCGTYDSHGDHHAKHCPHKSSSQRDKVAGVADKDSKRAKNKAAKKLAQEPDSHGCPRDPEEVDRLNRAAYEILADNPAFEALFHHITDILDEEYDAVADEGTELLDVAIAMRHVLMEHKDGRIDNGEDAVLVERQLQWADWMLQAIKAGVVHEKSPYCSDKCTDALRFSY